MATTKIILGKPRQDGSVSLDLQVLHMRKHREVPLKIWVKPGHFSNGYVSSDDPKHRIYNKFINESLEIADKVVLEYSRRVVSIGTLKEEIKKRLFGTTDLNATISSYSEKVIARLKEERRDGNAKSIRVAFDQLLKYTKKDVSFIDLNHQTLSGFKTYKLSAGIKLNTIGAYLRAIRAIYNAAIDEGVVSKEFYPFKRGLVPGAQKTKKKSVGKATITSIENDNATLSETQALAIDFVLTQFYLRGADFGDVIRLKPNNIVGNYIEFSRYKNRNKVNTTPVRVFILPQLKVILQRRKGGEYLFPYLKEKELSAEQIDNLRRNVYKAANRVAERLGLPSLASKVIRHTWATTARKYAGEGGYDIVHIAMGHAIDDITGTYIEYQQEDLDHLNEKVCNAIDMQVVHQRSA